MTEQTKVAEKKSPQVLLAELATLEQTQIALKAQLKAARDEQLSTIAANLTLSLEQGGFKLEDFLKLLVPSKDKQEKSATKKKAVPGLIPGTAYKNPVGDKDPWVCGSRGPTPAWIKDLVASGKNLADFAVANPAK
jgi:DNA-binding protein H-NS